MSETGAVLRAYRVKAGWNQESAAEKLGVSQQHLSRLETGKLRPSWWFLTRFAETFRVPVADLLAAAGLVPDTTAQQQDIAALASADPEVGELLDLLKGEPSLAAELLPWARYTVERRRREREDVGNPGE